MELAVTAVILSILVAIVGLPAPDNGAQSLQMAEIQIRDALRMAQSRAVSTRMPHGVSFDVANERFAVVDQNGNLAIDPLAKSGYVVDFTRPDQPPNLEIDTATFGNTAAAAIFDGQGVPMAGGTISLRCLDHVVTLAFDEATGLLAAL
jgi:hypothetical protein